MKLANVNQYTIPQMHTAALEAALARTTDRRLRIIIQAELDARRSAGVDRPVTMEDYL